MSLLLDLEAVFTRRDHPTGALAHTQNANPHAVGLTTTHPAEALAEAGADLVVTSLVGFDVAELLDRLVTERAVGRGSPTHCF